MTDRAARRAEVLAAIEGRHPRFGRRVAFLINLFIVISALMVALETMEGLPPWTLYAFVGAEILVSVAFLIEYLARLWASPRPLAYALSFWGIVDLLAILPILALLNPEWMALRILRLVRLVRLLKLARAAGALDRFQEAIQSVRGELAIAGILAALVVYVAAVGIYIFEHEAQPDAFGSIPESAWWAIVSFTTVGYGDSYPITAGGRLFTTLILFIGLGVIALPTAAITSAFIDLSRKEKLRKDRHEPQTAKSPGNRPLRPRHGRRHRQPRR